MHRGTNECNAMHAFNSQLSILNSQFLQLRRVATDLAALEQVLAPYGLVPLHDDAPLQEGQLNERAVRMLGETGYTVTRTGAGYTVTDAAGRVVAESVDGRAGR